jgi:hypothetical protein
VHNNSYFTGKNVDGIEKIIAAKRVFIAKSQHYSLIEIDGSALSISDRLRELTD